MIGSLGANTLTHKRVNIEVRDMDIPRGLKHNYPTDWNRNDKNPVETVSLPA